MGAVETIIVWENLAVNRYVLKNKVTGETNVLLLRPDQRTDRSKFMDKATNTELEVVEECLLLDYFTQNYKEFGAVLEIVSDKSSEGTQFVKGFGGIGGLLRYKVDFQVLGGDENNSDEDDFDMDDY